MKVAVIHVYVEYRFSGTPGEIPRDRLLRARCRQWSAEGWMYGRELIAPRRVVDVSTVERLCIEKLAELTREIVFEFDPRLGLPMEIRKIAA